MGILRKKKACKNRALLQAFQFISLLRLADC
jgi:hypothetical protein